MNEATLTIPNISCGHCVMSIQNELSEIAGVADVSGDADDQTIRVRWEPPATLDGIKAALAEINYPAV